MGFKLREFECKECSHEFEELVAEGEEIECPECKSKDLLQLVSTPRLNTMNLLSKDEYRQKMMKRSSDHTAKTLKQDGLPKQSQRNWDSLK